MIRGKRYLKNGQIFRAYRTDRTRRIPTPGGIDIATPGDYVVQDPRGRLFVELGWAFEELYEPLDKGKEG